MTEQSQLPLVGPPKRRGWREIVWFRPLTPSTHAALVVTRRGRLVSVLPAGGPRVLSDYLSWPYDFREVDTRERLLMLDQRLESFDSSYEFSVSLRLIYQVVQPDRVALELEDVSSELAYAVTQSLRLSGRSFGVEQDKAFEEHLQETLINSDALNQRARLLGLVLRRADITVTLDEPTRARAEALRFAMRERPLHFQVAIESLEPDRSFDVLVGGSYRLTERRAQDGPSDTIESAVQLAITRTLRRVGITFEPSDYPNAAKAMGEVLRKDALLQSELSMVQAQLLRPTVQIQPDRSMVHVPRPNPLEVPAERPDPMLRRARQGLPRRSRPPALVDMQARAPQPAPPPAVRRALPTPEAQPARPPAVRRALPPPEPPPADIAASQILPVGDLPAPGDPVEGPYTHWTPPESMPGMRALPTLGHTDDSQEADAPWADLISGAEDQPHDRPWSATRPATTSAPAEPLLWEHSAPNGADQPMPEEQAPVWSAIPATSSAPAEPLLWEHSAPDGADQPAPEEQAPLWSAISATSSAPAEPLPWEHSAPDGADQPAFGAARPAEDTWSGLDSIAGSEIASDVPGFLNSDLAHDLGFSLDWSEPEIAAPVAEPPAGAPAPTANPMPDELGFTLDWSEPQPDLYASAWVLSADTTTDDSIITAHWDDPIIAVPEPALFSDPPTIASPSADTETVNLDSVSVFDLDPAQPDLEQARPAGVPTVAEQGAEQDEAQAVIEQESPPWYTPTVPLDDYLPFDSAADDTGYAPIETFGTAWAEPLAAPSPPAYDQAADAFSQLPNKALDEELTATLEPASDLAPSDANELIAARAEPATEISAEQIARIIGMIQSYGPAWFKMWSLELKERPERLPIVLGEVTADPVLLAQADEPRVQSALLLALAAYTAPAAFPARLPASAPLPSPAIAGQSNDGEDEVPDWLSLRVKWNGHGGGA